MRQVLPVVVAFLLSSVSVVAWGQSAQPSGAREGSPVVEAGTGRDLLNYPPDPVAGLSHMRLEVDIPDMSVRRLNARQTLVLTPVDRAVSKITLDARLLKIEGVASAGRLAGHTHDGRRLVITLDPPVSAGERAEVVTRYVVENPEGGLVWSLEERGLSPELHSQGQAEMNSFWFPTHDFPNQRFTSEVIATVPAGFEAISNGRLVERREEGGRVRFHWSQEVPQVAYLVSLVVGRFEMVDVARPPRDRVPMPVWAPVGRGADALATFERTGEMVRVFERVLDEPYPFAKYGQVVARNFASGGMENTSVTTLWEGSLLGPASRAEGESDDLIAHELAHQWFGNLVTCRTWEHVWLNEGFATFMESVWAEERLGRDAALVAMLGHLDELAERDLAEGPGATPMVSKAYLDPDDVFERAASPYAKGALLLHVVRARLGEEVFWRGVRTYVDRFRLKEVETSDLRKVLEEVSGESLEGVFEQWCDRAGVARVEAAVEWEPRSGGPGGDLVVTLRQTQRIDGANPAMSGVVPVVVLEREASGRQGATWREAGRVVMAGRESVGKFPLDREPAIVAVDPEVVSGAVLSVRQPVGRWVRQVREGPTWVSRIQAARALGSAEDDAAVEALRGVARDDREPAAVRREAILALGRRGDVAGIEGLSRGMLSGAGLRAAVVRSAEAIALDGRTEPDDRAVMVGVVRTAALGDPSPRARGAGLEGVGRLRVDDAEEILSRGLETDSDGDRLREAAARGLGALNSPGALRLAVRAALPGLRAGTRAEALRAVGVLSVHDRRAALVALEAGIEDANREVWTAAAEGLALVRDPKAGELLARLAESRGDELDRRRVERLARGGVRGETALGGTVAAGVGSEWLPIDRAESWSGTAAGRQALIEDAATALKPRGLVGRSTASGPEIKVRMGESTGVLAVRSVEGIESGGRVRGLIVVLEDGSAARGLTEGRESARVAVVVGGRVVGTVPVVSPLGGEIRVGGEMDAASLEALRGRVREAGGVVLVVCEPAPR